MSPTDSTSRAEMPNCHSVWLSIGTDPLPSVSAMLGHAGLSSLTVLPTRGDPDLQ